MNEKTKYIALLRGVNVGGKNKLPMKELVVLLEASGFGNVKTYIQSGNIILSNKQTDQFVLSEKIKQLIFEQYNFAPNVLVLSLDEIEQAAKDNPFEKAQQQPNLLHLFFLEQFPTNPDFKRVDEIKLASENYLLKGKIFYLHTPEGFGRSKLAMRAEKLLGVNCTARNWRSINKIIELVKNN